MYNHQLEDRCGFKVFVRSHHGVQLTPAGRSLLEDSRTIIRLSDEALRKAKRLAESAETTVRIATALLFKCRLLPSIWTEISSRFPVWGGSMTSGKASMQTGPGPGSVNFWNLPGHPSAVLCAKHTDWQERNSSVWTI